MAKKIIILEKIDDDLSFRAAFWAPVPSTRWSLYANAAATSAYKNISGPELTSLQAGEFVEKVETFKYPSGTAVGVIQTDLVNKYNDFKDYIANFNPFVQYGRFYDGTSWTAGGVA